ncbi:MAG: NAD-dependent dihydropyrimidine dehydrogenase subunit PreA [Flavobacteriales bacterium]|nr:NAD-dependent dihydropyrimidine dehydrogenase subunit PreA [Flavobacteriales bacterium]MBK7246383.1 NAD-dependent dihydropyrimidine dehydrogenase subunit PreA [Flavobacteriales bacterium]MBK7286030.1 NAD-dependent dihydropyrimidine dehydrogenase subunit PreA [Flavobacteriales bacterium]MBK9059841.1 NAD-dependent dihydropyrimidine dehydrogenase subunit PreA [Flavobacteriales bacterium]QQS72070.1 MAG: NAD-dependent dihydropyrimidine dehydrogenase subunit PreA [Flavobacteriales bacterium]
MADLRTNLAGIKSPNPFWLASAPPTNSGYQIMKAFDAGWGGAVWKTLGVPVVNVSSRYGSLNYRDNRMVGFNNIELITDRPLKDNLREISEVKKRFPDHAVIASLMVETREEWHNIVRDVENAGADGIELNFGCPHGMCERGMGSAVGQEPKVLQTIVEWVKEVAKIPVITKLTPNISDITRPARAARAGGSDAISLINTIQSVIGVDLDTFVPSPNVDGKSTNGGYCGPAVKPIALNMLKNCAQDKQVGIPISGIGGVENWRDAAEFILLGATSVQVCTAVMHFGFGIIRDLKTGLERYMDEKGFKTIEDFRGKALPNILHWEDLNLKYKVVADINKDKCIGCQLCYTACEDGAHQAISLSNDPADRKPTIIEENCVGCNLCSIVCPVEECITMERRDDGKEHLTWGDRTRAGNIPKTFDDPLAGGLHHWVPEPAEALAKVKPRHYKG